MAFRELKEGVASSLPKGASDRYATLETLGRMVKGEQYEHLRYAFETEKSDTRNYIPLRNRRPSVDFNLASEILQDTLAELFGDEQFPTVKMSRDGEEDDDATAALAELIEELAIGDVMTAAYEEGCIGSVAIVLMRQPNGLPYYDVLPAKWCQPIYRSQYSNELESLIVTYPIAREKAEKQFPDVVKADPDQNYWYRYIVGPSTIVDYLPLSDAKFTRLGDTHGSERIAFEQARSSDHGFMGRVPVVFSKNLAPLRGREIDGPCLWWPVRNMCVEIDYTLSQCGRGIRYTSDPKLFVRRGDLFDQDDVAAGYAGPAGGMSSQNLDGDMVHGATNTLVGGPGSDAKILEINANGQKEAREFVRDLREYALEVLGGMKARAEHLRAAPSGKAIDKGLKPLRRLVRRQRRPYGNGALLSLVDLTLYGFAVDAFDRSRLDLDWTALLSDAKRFLDWPTDETLQGADLLAHVSGMQMAAGGSVKSPKELIAPDAVGEKLAADLGFHQPYDTIKGDADAQEADANANDSGTSQGGAAAS